MTRSRRTSRLTAVVRLLTAPVVLGALLIVPASTPAAAASPPTVTDVMGVASIYPEQDFVSLQWKPSASVAGDDSTYAGSAIVFKKGGVAPTSLSAGDTLKNGDAFVSVAGSSTGSAMSFLWKRSEREVAPSDPDAPVPTVVSFTVFPRDALGNYAPYSSAFSTVVDLRVSQQPSPSVPRCGPAFVPPPGQPADRFCNRRPVAQSSLGSATHLPSGKVALLSQPMDVAVDAGKPQDPNFDARNDAITLSSAGSTAETDVTCADGGSMSSTFGSAAVDHGRADGSPEHREGVVTALRCLPTDPAAPSEFRFSGQAPTDVPCSQQFICFAYAPPVAGGAAVTANVGLRGHVMDVVAAPSRAGSNGVFAVRVLQLSADGCSDTFCNSVVWLQVDPSGAIHAIGSTILPPGDNRFAMRFGDFTGSGGLQLAVVTIDSRDAQRVTKLRLLDASPTRTGSPLIAETEVDRRTRSGGLGEVDLATLQVPAGAASASGIEPHAYDALYAAIRFDQGAGAATFRINLDLNGRARLQRLVDLVTADAYALRLVAIDSPFGNGQRGALVALVQRVTQACLDVGALHTELAVLPISPQRGPDGAEPQTTPLLRHSVGCRNSNAPIGDLFVADARPVASQSVLPVPKRPAEGAAQLIMELPVEQAQSTNKSTALYSVFFADCTGRSFCEGQTRTTPGLRTALSQPRLVAGSSTAQKRAVAAHNARGSVLIGEPKVQGVDNVEPLVVLNAPPTHFDLIDGEIADINVCYNSNLYRVPTLCGYNSTYTKTQSLDRTVTASVNEDWSFGVNVSGGASAGIAAIEASANASVGGSFGNTDIQATRTSVTVETTAVNDDQVYALYKHYDILEYPIYDLSQVTSSTELPPPATYLLSVSPTVTRKTWLNATSPQARSFRTRHETGNLLSYPRDDSPAENPDMATTGSGAGLDFGGDHYQISNASNFQYKLDRESLTSSSRSNTFKAGVEVNVAGTFGDKDAGNYLTVGVSGSYARESLQTATTEVGESLQVGVLFGGVDRTFGQSGYLVEPFGYYSKAGALVLDYAISPDRATDGTDTFWQKHYGKGPDTTFNLPYRLDPEKSLAVDQDALRWQSKDVQLVAGTCAKPQPRPVVFPRVGDQACAVAEVQNYALDDDGVRPQDGPTASQALAVDFYLGDPDYGGRYVGTDTTVGPLLPRDSEVAMVDLTIPRDHEAQNLRLFAVVRHTADSAMQGPELRLSDKKAWNGFRVFSPPSPRTFDPPAVRQAPRVRAVAPEGTTGSLDVTWDAADGATYYTVDVWERDLDSTDTTPTVRSIPTGRRADCGTAVSRSCLVTGLPAGKTYVATVTARAGTAIAPISNPSEPVELGTQPAVEPTAPGAPTTIGLVPGDGTATASWQPPASDGGSPITGYRVTLLPGGRTVETAATATSVALTDLVNGQPYSVTVAALNHAGTSAASAASPEVVPAGTPLAVRDLAVEEGNGALRVEWLPGGDNGRPITGYRVTTSPGSSRLVEAGTRSLVLLGLENGTSYDVAVTAVNEIGAGQASQVTGMPFAPPGAPPSVSATAGEQRLEVAWTEAAPQGRPITGYRIVLSPGGRTQQVGGAERTVTFDALTGGTSYTAAVSAVNAAGEGPATMSAPATVTAPPGTGGGSTGGGGGSQPPPGATTPTPSSTGTPSASASPSPSASAAASAKPTPDAAPSPTTGPGTPGSVATSGLHPLTPTRLLDTREGNSPITAAQDRLVRVAGLAGVPSSGARGVVMNVTVTRPTQAMDLQVFASGDRPARRTSNLNVVSGVTRANLVTTAIGDDGRIALSVSAGSAHVVIDVLGWFGEGGDGYTALVPERRADTRTTRPMKEGVDHVVRLFDSVPPGVTAAVVGITALGAERPTDVAAYAAGDRPQRRTSTLNLVPGQTVANLAVVPVDAAGRIALSTAAGTVHAVVDLFGYWSRDSESKFVPVQPARVLDTRAERMPLDAKKPREVKLGGTGGVPSTGVDAVVVNVTSVGSTAVADLQLAPARQVPARRTSNLNVRPGETIATLAVVKLGRDGRVVMSTSQGAMHVVLDVVGYIASG
jgi:hypothetical protein